MKYFAILKDSIREAIDSKVMYVLFAVSTVAVLLVGTLAFKPLSARATFEQFFPDPARKNICIMFAALYHPELTSAGLDEKDVKAKEKRGDEIIEKMQPIFEYKLEEVECIRGAADAPDSDYVVTITDAFAKMAKKQEQAQQIAKGIERVRVIFEKAEQFEMIRIDGIKGEIEWKDLPMSAEAATMAALTPPLGTAALVLEESRRDLEEPRFIRSRYRVTVHGTPRTIRIWAHEPSFFFGAIPIQVLRAPLSFQLFVLAQNVMSFGAWVAILIGVVITSFFIPNMLSKGTIDLLLVKPIHRWALLIYKYVGGLTFILLCTLYAIGGMWLMLGLRTGVWPHGIVLLVATMTFFFAILYAISTFVAVMTRNTIATIIVTLLAWAACFSIGLTHKYFEGKQRAEARQEKRDEKLLPADERWGDSRLATASRILNAVTPRTEELNVLNDRIVYYSFMTSVTDMRKFDSPDRPWWESLLVSFAWIACFLGLACWVFSFRDY